jgi:mannobiose 2-epimerase
MPVSPPETRRGPRLRVALGCALLTLLLLTGAGPAARAQAAGAQLGAEQAARFAEQAATFRRQLSEQVMPFWYDRTIDREMGGYVLPGASTSDKLLVSQARLIWGFAYAHRNGIRDPQRDYLAAATNGYRFLRSHFLDPFNGGYYWLLSRVGRPLNARKFLFGQACVLYALVEYYRASGDPAALDDAVALYRTLLEHAHDPVNGGFAEHFEADWRPVTDIAPVVAPTEEPVDKEPSSQELIIDPETVVDVGIVGTRSGEAHLQLMEALTALLAVSRDPAAAAALGDLKVEDALAEVLDLNLSYFFPQNAGAAYPYRQPDWRRPLGAKFREINYGRNVEFAWQMLATQQALGREPMWQRFDALVQHALKHGFDAERGGLYAIGFGDRAALATEKTWWAQAEMLAALTTGVAHDANPDYVRALEQLLGFLNAHLIDPRDGMWFDAVQADGSPWRTAKVSRSKTSYHDLRAMQTFIAAFGAS